MSTTEKSVDNGVNVEALLDAREALTAAPEAAQFTWRATCKWVNGTHSHSDRRKDFSAWARSSIHRTEFNPSTPIIPEIFASEDKGATPVEYGTRRVWPAA